MLSNAISTFFLRAKKNQSYLYMGVLEYFSHDPNATKPVHFIWKIQNWDCTKNDLSTMGIPTLTPLDPAYSLPAPEPEYIRLTRVQAPQTGHMPPERPRRSTAPKPATIDWTERDARNHQLGLRGEKLVLRYEIETLRAAGREDLANQVLHVALHDSAAGFDIQSFYLDGRPKRIEVKTTQGPASTPFFISRNEVLASQEDPDSYVIYRVFDLRNDADTVKFFELTGDVEAHSELVPTHFRAYPAQSQ